MKRLALITLIAATACSHEYKWEGSGDVNKDDYECRRDAYATAAMAGGPSGPNTVAGRDQFQRCMKARGYVDKNA